MSTFAEFDSWLVVQVATGFGAASLAGKLLGDLGCTVAAVDFGDDEVEGADDTERELRELVSRGKHSVVVAPGRPGAVDALDAMLRSAEILVADRAGLLRLQAMLGMHDLRERYPRLTVCACTLFGIEGPMAAWTGGEEIVQAVGGIMSITGHPGSGPTRVAGAPLTHTAAMFAVTSALADVLRKRAGAPAGSLDVSVYDAAIAFHAASLPAYRLGGSAPEGIGNRHSMSAPWNSYRCADGWLIICSGNHSTWVRLCETIGRPDLLADPRYATQHDRIVNVDALDAEISAWMASRSLAEVERLLDAGAVPYGSILPLHDVLRHAQFRERNLSDAASQNRQAGGVFHLNREPLDVREGAWQRGSGTRTILLEHCGVSSAQYDRWVAAAAVGEAQRRPSVEAA